MVKNVEVLLEKIKENNKKATELNRQNDLNRGYAKSKIEDIRKKVAELEELGWKTHLEFDELTIDADSIKKFEEVYKKIVSEFAKKYDEQSKLIDAVESKDYDKIKELTGQDVRKVDYSIDVDLDSLKDDFEEAVAKAKTEGISISRELDKADFSLEAEDVEDEVESNDIELDGNESDEVLEDDFELDNEVDDDSNEDSEDDSDEDSEDDSDDFILDDYDDEDYFVDDSDVEDDLEDLGDDEDDEEEDDEDDSSSEEITLSDDDDDDFDLSDFF